MSASVCELYPRTLHLWTKSDDKRLLQALKAGDNLLVLAETLQREYVSVVNRLNSLDLFAFDCGSEEWVEVMTLALGGAPLGAVVDWCNGAEARLPYAEIEASLVGDFRSEFELARDLRLDVTNFEAIADLTWLLAQPEAIMSGYAAAAEAVNNRFDVLTPATLKAQVLGLVPASAPWPLVLPVREATKRKRPQTKAFRGTKTYRRRRSSNSSAGHAKRKSNGRSSTGKRGYVRD
ncbi:hypothetical protein SAMN04489711_1503 [Paracidovorax wautersii]|uniref:Uncharacterized protein n=2 Tax=Paracidovorax wautersii TaxID=1177982 RepID=A0A1I2I0D3_9BURK|nr:hypothetical protein SAMN04489711_1503 [Paracidovorax wautersii]